MHDNDDSYDRRETGEAREKLLAVGLSFAAVVLAAVGSSLAFLSDVSARFAAVDSHLAALQSDLVRIQKESDVMETDIRQAIAVHHALSERIAIIESKNGKPR